MLSWVRANALPLWLFAVVIVYPIPHTIALRNLLLVSGLLTACYILWRQRAFRQTATPSLSGFLRLAAILLAALTGWMFFQSAFISPYPSLALGMLRGDWIVALLVAVTAICAAKLETPQALGRIATAIVCALFAHVVILLAYQGHRWIGTGHFPFGITPFGAKDYHSMLVTTLAALLIGELVARARSGRSFLRLTTSILVLMSTLTLISNATLTARNAVLITLLLMFFGAAVWILGNRKRPSSRTFAAIVIVLVAIGVAAWLGIRSDARWQGFSAAVDAGLDRTGSLAWLEKDKHPWPSDSQGQAVEESAYLRTAWARVALEQIAANSLGLGYGHKAFGWAVNRAYNVQTGHESSHSGLLDFTLANGVPGLLLWLAFSACIVAAGWQAFRRTDSPTGLILTLTVLAYITRCAVDGHLSGWRLEMYALVVGTLVVAMLKTERPCA